MITANGIKQMQSDIAALEATKSSKITIDLEQFSKVLDLALKGLDEWEAIPEEASKLIRELGPVEWGATSALTAKEHAKNTELSFGATSAYFDQSGPQRMNGLYLKGEETVVCQTGTSPNSPIIAQTLVRLWNHLHANLPTPPKEGGE